MEGLDKNKYYLIMRPDEDGEYAMILSKDEVNEYLSDLEYLKESMEFTKNIDQTDPQSWGESKILIVELGDVVIPNIKLSI